MHGGGAERERERENPVLTAGGPDTSLDLSKIMT